MGSQEDSSTPVVAAVATAAATASFAATAADPNVDPTSIPFVPSSTARVASDAVQVHPPPYELYVQSVSAKLGTRLDTHCHPKPFSAF